MKKTIFIIALMFCLNTAGYSSGIMGGFTLGTPGLLNVNGGAYGDIFGIQFSASVLHLLDAETNNSVETSGVYYALLQFNLDCKMVETENLIFAGSVAGGTMCFSDDGAPEDDVSIFYVGPCIHLIWYGLYIEAGAAYGRDFSAKYDEDKNHIIPLVQLGYYFRY